MKIETKYNCGDEVFVLHENQVKLAKIDNFYVHVAGKLSSPNEVKTTYSCHLLGNRDARIGSLAEEKLFATKEELLKSL